MVYHSDFWSFSSGRLKKEIRIESLSIYCFILWYLMFYLYDRCLSLIKPYCLLGFSTCIYLQTVLPELKCNARSCQLTGAHRSALTASVWALAKGTRGLGRFRRCTGWAAWAALHTQPSSGRKPPDKTPFPDTNGVQLQSTKYEGNGERNQLRHHSGKRPRAYLRKAKLQTERRTNT